ADERYPQVVSGLHRPVFQASGLTFPVLHAKAGDMVQIINTPAWLPPGPIKLIIAGRTHSISSTLHQIAWNTIPETPYETLVSDDATLGRADTDGSSLASNASSGAASLSVATTNSTSPLWTTAAGDMPFYINIAGEQIKVTAVSGSSSPQTFT